MKPFDHEQGVLALGVEGPLETDAAISGTLEQAPGRSVVGRRVEPHQIGPLVLDRRLNAFQKGASCALLPRGTVHGDRQELDSPGERVGKGGDAFRHGKSQGAPTDSCDQGKRQPGVQPFPKDIPIGTVGPEGQRTEAVDKIGIRGLGRPNAQPLDARALNTRLR